MTLAIKRVHNLPPHLISYVSTLPDTTQKNENLCCLPLNSVSGSEKNRFGVLKWLCKELVVWLDPHSQYVFEVTSLCLYACMQLFATGGVISVKPWGSTPPLPSPPLPPPLEVGSLNFQLGVWGSAVAPPARSGAEPQPKSNLVHFGLQI